MPKALPAPPLRSHDHKSIAPVAKPVKSNFQASAVAIVSLKSDPRIIEATKDSSAYLSKVSMLVISEESDLGTAADLLGAAKHRIEQIETVRKLIVKPLNDHVKYLNSEFKLLTQPFEKGRELLHQKIGVYREQLEQRRIKQAVAKQEDVYEPPAATVVGTSSVLQTRKTWTYEIVDLGKVHPMWLKSVLDEEAVQKAIDEAKQRIKDGVPGATMIGIAGLRIYEKESYASY